MATDDVVRVLSTVDLPESEVRAVCGISSRVELVHVGPDPQAWMSTLPEAEIWLGQVHQALLAPQFGPKLRWMQVGSAGVEALVDNTAVDWKVIVTNASGVQSVGIAEYVMGMLLVFARKFPVLLHNHEQRNWPTGEGLWAKLEGTELRGRTLGMIGYGSIGSAVAQLAHAFGMRVLACKRQPTVHQVPRWNPPGAGDPGGLIPERFYGPEQLCECVAGCDYVVVACPMTRETRGMINETLLRAMQPHAVLINVGRGGVMDEEALGRALRGGWIAGAALDVVAREPLPEDSILFDLPNLFITPHISSFTEAYGPRLIELFSENLRRYLTGRPLVNVVDHQRGY
jgi:phosphoglycerate dehydrogenase-like enzyme